MKLVAKFENLGQADEAAMLLNAHGIVTHVSARNTKSLRLFIHSDVDAELWALIDNQLDDAVALLRDDTYEVTTGLSNAQIQQLDQTAERGVRASINRAILYAGALMLLLICAVLATAYWL